MELNIDLTEYLKKFKVRYPTSLFEPDFRFLQEFRCPICYRRLYWNYEKTIARCKSVKKDKFFIRKETLVKFGVKEYGIK